MSAEQYSHIREELDRDPTRDRVHNATADGPTERRKQTGKHGTYALPWAESLGRPNITTSARYCLFLA